MIKKNFKSDFSFFLTLYDRDGKPIGFPTYNFSFKVYGQTGGRSVKGFRHGEHLKNCVEHEGGPAYHLQ